MPEDIEIQDYSGSTSEEEFAVKFKWEKKKLKTSTIQDEANSVLKQEKETVEEMFQQHQDLIKQIGANHEPEKIFLCEIPSKKNSKKLVAIKSGCNEKIDVFNHRLNQQKEHDERYQVIPLNPLLASKNNVTAYYHKNIHSNNAMRTTLPKNLFLSFLLAQSDNFP